MLCLASNSYVEIQLPTVALFGNGATKEVIKLNGQIKLKRSQGWGPDLIGLVSSQEETQEPALPLSICLSLILCGMSCCLGILRYDNPTHIPRHVDKDFNLGVLP